MFDYSERIKAFRKERVRLTAEFREKLLAHRTANRSRLINRLPDFMKQVVLMAYYQGLKYQEIAEALDIPLGTVKSRLHAALVKSGLRSLR